MECKAMVAVNTSSKVEMNELLRKNVSLVKYPDVVMEEVYLIDQLLSNGRSTGACFKLVFDRHKSSITTIYIFPYRRWCSATDICRSDIAAIMDEWIRIPLNEPV